VHAIHQPERCAQKRWIGFETQYRGQRHAGMTPQFFNRAVLQFTLRVKENLQRRGRYSHHELSGSRVPVLFPVRPYEQGFVRAASPLRSIEFGDGEP
jgi:hypothetical protein